MAIYQITPGSLVKVNETKYGDHGIFERRDLQRLLKEQIQVLAPDLMVITEEYGDWADSNRRIDLLCIDKEANLVVVEIKRTDDGGHMELQALRYAAMVSAMTFDQMVEAHAAFKSGTGTTKEQAEGAILQFLGWEEPQEDDFAVDVRIILASADFSKELTTTVIWLNQRGIDVRCIRMKPYKMEGGAVLMDVQQLIPLPEANDYQTQIKAKEKAGREHRAERYGIRYRFWSELLKLAKAKTDLHAGRKPVDVAWVGGGIGKAGLALNYATREDDSQVEIYIDFGNEKEEKNLQVFHTLESHRSKIEEVFGGELDWQELPDSRACRIRKILPGGYRSPESEWPKIHGQMVDAMIRLDAAFRPFVQQLKV
jgi:hypothetical protein